MGIDHGSMFYPVLAMGLTSFSGSTYCNRFYGVQVPHPSKVNYQIIILTSFIKIAMRYESIDQQGIYFNG